VRPTKRRLLCVDDDAETNEVLSNLLNAENYEIKTVGSVEYALQLAKRESFNLYILENWFKQGSGIEFCRKVREFDPHTPIVFYSGSAFESDRDEALYAGATAFVSKPQVDKLIATVHTLLSDRADSSR
jgi:CheY-like chemotaxis protein